MNEANKSDNSELESYNNKKSYFLKIKILLIMLYTIQGLILGFILSNLITTLKKDLSFKEIATLQLCSYPFSLKLLWSPIVDTYYLKSLGKRKTWLISTQILIAACLILLSYNFDDLIENKKILILTTFCFVLIFFVATQDIALDGWALNLCIDNTTLASSCQTFGQIIGHFVVLSSSKINKEVFLKNELNIPNYFYGLGIYVGLLTIILLFINENPQFGDIYHQSNQENEESRGIIETVKLLFKIFSKKEVIKYLVMTGFINFSFSYHSSVPGLVLIDKKFPVEDLQLISSLTIPVSLYVSQMFEGKKNDFYKLYFKAMYFYIVMIIIDYFFLYNYDYILNDLLSGNLSQLFWFVLFQSILETIISITMFQCSCGFMSSIVDKTIGGTYITALNSFSNLSKKIPEYFILNAVEIYGFNSIGAISIFYVIICLSLFSSKVIAIEEEGPNQWQLSSLSKNKLN